MSEYQEGKICHTSPEPKSPAPTSRKSLSDIDDRYFEGVGDVCLVDFVDKHLRTPLWKYGSSSTQVWLYGNWQAKKLKEELLAANVKLKTRDETIKNLRARIEKLTAGKVKTIS